MTRLFAGSRMALTAAMATLLLLAACGKKEEAPELAPDSASAEEPEPEIGSGNPMKDMLDEQKRVEQDKRAQANRMRDQIWEDRISAKLAEGKPESAQEAKVMRLQLALA